MLARRGISLIRSTAAAAHRTRLPVVRVSGFRLMSDVARPAHTQVALPALSPTMETGTIVSWEVKEGEEVADGDVIARIETDKAVMEWEAPEPGFLAKILVPEGSKDVKLGTPVCVLVSEESDVPAFADFKVTEKSDAATPSEPAAEAPSQTEAATPAPTTSSPPTPVSTPPTTSFPSAEGDRVKASPLAKMVAAQRGIVLPPRSTRIRVADLDEIAASSATTAGAATSRYTDIPLTGMRKTIAKRLVESKQTVPHYYLTVEVRMDTLLATRAEMNKSLDGKAKLSVNDFVIKAAAMAMHKVPEVNSSWQDTFIRQYNNVDVSVAVATPQGLITPIVFDADRKGLTSINEDVLSLAEKAKNSTLQPQEFQGGTFTISNLGMFGVKSFTAIINPPQACILAVGSSEERLVADESTASGYRKTQVMSVTLSCDHRVVDGAVGAQWLKVFKQNMEQPHNMLL